MIKKIIALITMLSVILMCAGCQAAEHKEVTPTTKSDVCTIGLSFDSFVIERWTRDRDVFVSTANELGAEVNVQSAGGDVETQISMWMPSSLLPLMLLLLRMLSWKQPQRAFPSSATTVSSGMRARIFIYHLIMKQ